MGHTVVLVDKASSVTLYDLAKKPEENAVNFNRTDQNFIITIHLRLHAGSIRDKRMQNIKIIDENCVLRYTTYFITNC